MRAWICLILACVAIVLLGWLFSGDDDDSRDDQYDKP